jgi:hypothetical protein
VREVYVAEHAMIVEASLHRVKSETNIYIYIYIYIYDSCVSCACIVIVEASLHRVKSETNIYIYIYMIHVCLVHVS